MTWNSRLLTTTAILVAATSGANIANASQIVVSAPAQNTSPAGTQSGQAGNTNLSTQLGQQNTSNTGAGNTGAANTGATNAGSTIPNSSENYLDDRLAWPSAIEAKASLGGDYTDGFCIPANTKVIGAHSGFDTNVQQTTSSGSSSTGTSASQFQAVTLDTNPPYLGLFGKRPKSVAPPADAATACPDVKTAKTSFSKGDLAFISADDMKNVGYRAGFDYGALLVPFKMQLSGGKAFTGSASVGGYVGYQNPIANLGVNVSPILFAGASNISTSASTGTKTSSQTVAGLSYGTGLLFNIKDSFQAGFVFGFDHVSSAQKYQYNDKPWISFEIGYSFAN